MSYPIIRLCDVLAKPVESVLDSQKTINANTLRLIDSYKDDNGDMKFLNYTVNNDDGSKYEIKVPELTMVNVPSLTVRDMKITMNLEDKKRDESNNLMVSLSTEQSKWKSYKIELQVSESTEPMGIHRLNTILMDSVKTNKIVQPSNDTRS
jgi:hypothetical protein